MLHFLWAGFYHHWKRKCQRFYVCSGEDLRTGCIYGGVCTGRGAENLTGYTEEYDRKIETVLDRIEEITGERGRIRKQEIVDDAQAEIDDAKAELEEGKLKAQEELDDAKAQIDDGEAKLTEAKQQIADGKSQISSAKTTLNSKEDELTEAKTQYSSGLKKWQEGTEAYEAGLAQFEAAKPGALEEIAKARKDLKRIGSN